MRWWAQCQYHCKTITGGDHAEARIIDSSLMWNIRIHPATKPPYHWAETLWKGIHHRKGTAGLLISNIYVSVGIGIELLKWLAPIWPLTRKGGKNGKEIEKEEARKDRNKKTAPLLQIYVSDVKFWSRRGIVYWLSTLRSALCPREHHTLVSSTRWSKLITPDFFHLSLPPSIYFHRVSEGKPSPNKWTLLLSKEFPLLSTGWNVTENNNWGN